MRLGKSYSPERLEAACQRALTLGACSYKSIESILKHGLDRQPLPQPPEVTPSPHHANIRGPQYSNEDAEWKQARVNIDYHVEVEGHYYSVPYTLVKQQLDVRLSAHVVERFHKGKRVASHRRSPLKGRHSTVAAHMPTAHQRYAEWTPQWLMHWAAHSGPVTAQVVETILASRPHPQQGFRSC